MNWFERYGIPGLYFSSYIFICIFSPYFKDSGKDHVKEVLLVFTGLSLPAGYILSVLSQLLYYKILCCFHIHRYAMNSYKPEETLEGQMVKIFRIDLHVDKVAKCRWVSEWISKRVDVIAINNSILFATVIGYTLYCLQNQIFDIQPSETHTKIITIISFVIVTILLLNTCILAQQVKRFTKALYQSKDYFLRPKEDPIYRQRPEYD